MPERTIDAAVSVDDRWGAALRCALESAEPALTDLVMHLATCARPVPAAAWRRTTRRLLSVPGARELVLESLHTMTTCDTAQVRYYSTMVIQGVITEANVPVAMGMVWAAALTDAEVVVGDLTAVVHRLGGLWLHDFASRQEIGQAAVAALAELTHPAALEALWALHRDVQPHSPIERVLTKGLAAAVHRHGVSADVAAERGARGFGLGPEDRVRIGPGSPRSPRLSYTADLIVEEGRRVVVVWHLPEGGQVRTTTPWPSPRGFKRRFSEADVESARAKAKAIQRELTTHRARLETLLTAGRIWTLPDWTRSYRDHPLVGTITCRTVWRFRTERDAGWTEALPTAGGDLIGLDGETLALSGGAVEVGTWHPGTDTGAVQAWRDRLTALGVRPALGDWW